MIKGVRAENWRLRPLCRLAGGSRRTRPRGDRMPEPAEAGRGRPRPADAARRAGAAGLGRSGPSLTEAIAMDSRAAGFEAAAASAAAKPSL